eukprot:GHVN01089587.1.p1 GENE.GHVN01089587.1~~GHVN01089587.1.p1  ORF type:complete len:1651 (-),score=328.99 GHVN01089587.1:83-5035(-)
MDTLVREGGEKDEGEGVVKNELFEDGPRSMSEPVSNDYPSYPNEDHKSSDRRAGDGPQRGERHSTRLLNPPPPPSTFSQSQRMGGRGGRHRGAQPRRNDPAVQGGEDNQAKRGRGSSAMGMLGRRTAEAPPPPPTPTVDLLSRSFKLPSLLSAPVNVARMGRSQRCPIPLPSSNEIATRLGLSNPSLASSPRVVLSLTSIRAIAIEVWCEHHSSRIKQEASDNQKESMNEVTDPGNPTSPSLPPPLPSDSELKAVMTTIVGDMLCWLVDHLEARWCGRWWTKRKATGAWVYNDDSSAPSKGNNSPHTTSGTSSPQPQNNRSASSDSDACSDRSSDDSTTVNSHWVVRFPFQVRRKGKQFNFLTRWVNWHPKDDTWEPPSSFMTKGMAAEECKFFGITLSFLAARYIYEHGVLSFRLSCANRGELSTAASASPQGAEAFAVAVLKSCGVGSAMVEDVSVGCKDYWTPQRQARFELLSLLQRHRRAVIGFVKVLDQVRQRWVTDGSRLSEVTMRSPKTVTPSTQSTITAEAASVAGEGSDEGGELGEAMRGYVSSAVSLCTEIIALTETGDPLGNGEWKGSERLRAVLDWVKRQKRRTAHVPPPIGLISEIASLTRTANEGSVLNTHQSDNLPWSEIGEMGGSCEGDEWFRRGERAVPQWTDDGNGIRFPDDRPRQTTTHMITGWGWNGKDGRMDDLHHLHCSDCLDPSKCREVLLKSIADQARSAQLGHHKRHTSCYCERDDVLEVPPHPFILAQLRHQSKTVDDIRVNKRDILESLWLPHDVIHPQDDDNTDCNKTDETQTTSWPEHSSMGCLIPDAVVNVFMGVETESDTLNRYKIIQVKGSALGEENEEPSDEVGWWWCFNQGKKDKELVKRMKEKNESMRICQMTWRPTLSGSVPEMSYLSSDVVRLVYPSLLNQWVLKQREQELMNRLPVALTVLIPSIVLAPPHLLDPKMNNLNNGNCRWGSLRCLYEEVGLNFWLKGKIYKHDTNDTGTKTTCEEGSDRGDPRRGNGVGLRCYEPHDGFYPLIVADWWRRRCSHLTAGYQPSCPGLSIWHTPIPESPHQLLTPMTLNQSGKAREGEISEDEGNEGGDSLTLLQVVGSLTQVTEYFTFLFDSIAFYSSTYLFEHPRRLTLFVLLTNKMRDVLGGCQSISEGVTRVGLSDNLKHDLLFPQHDENGAQPEPYHNPAPRQQALDLLENDPLLHSLGAHYPLVMQQEPRHLSTMLTSLAQLQASAFTRHFFSLIECAPERLTPQLVSQPPKSSCAVPPLDPSLPSYCLASNHEPARSSERLDSSRVKSSRLAAQEPLWQRLPSSPVFIPPSSPGQVDSTRVSPSPNCPCLDLLKAMKAREENRKELQGGLNKKNGEGITRMPRKGNGSEDRCGDDSVKAIKCVSSKIETSQDKAHHHDHNCTEVVALPYINHLFDSLYVGQQDSNHALTAFTDLYYLPCHLALHDNLWAIKEALFLTTGAPALLSDHMPRVQPTQAATPACISSRIYQDDSSDITPLLERISTSFACNNQMICSWLASLIDLAFIGNLPSPDRPQLHNQPMSGFFNPLFSSAELDAMYHLTQQHSKTEVEKRSVEALLPALPTWLTLTAARSRGGSVALGGKRRQGAGDVLSPKLSTILASRSTSSISSSDSGWTDKSE